MLEELEDDNPRIVDLDYYGRSNGISLMDVEEMWANYRKDPYRLDEVESEPTCYRSDACTLRTR